MKNALLALAAAAVVGACGTDGPTAPTPARTENGGGVATAMAFPDQQNGGRLLTADMIGANEAPVTGDPDGHGTARFTLNPGLEQVCFALEVTGIEPARAAHIHVAPAGQPGPIVVPLTAPTSGSSSGCVTASRDLILAIMQDPGAYYVNVHNQPFPGGALRGQLSK